MCFSILGSILFKVTASTDLIRRTQRSVSRLRAEVRFLRQQLIQQADAAFGHALRRRGLIIKKVLHDGCIVPRSAAAREEYYQLLGHYSFRLFLRDVITHRQRFAVADLLRYCSEPTARRYLHWLVEHQLARRTGAHYRLAVDAVSFGPTLEWFVATALRREYGIPSAWNVHFEATKTGGDYDVIGLQEGTCVYIEAKSSPPRNIDAGQAHTFFDRLETLRPQIAIFLNDTQLRMTDKIVPLFTQELRRRVGTHAAAVQRLEAELFVAGDGLFIANADPDLIGNVGVCLAHYLRQRGLHLNRIS